MSSVEDMTCKKCKYKWPCKSKRKYIQCPSCHYFAKRDNFK